MSTDVNCSVYQTNEIGLRRVLVVLLSGWIRHEASGIRNTTSIPLMWVLRLVMAGLFMLPSMMNALSVPLTITENAGITRVNEPVTSGVPFPSSLNLLTTNSLAVLDGSTPVPAQFKVTGRWGGTPTDTTKPIKWVLVDFQANVPANTSKIYTLTDTGSGNASSGITVSDGPTSIVVNTSAAAFTISKTQFNLFDNVNIKDPATGQLTLNVLSSQPTAGASITRVSNGTTYYAANRSISVAVEDLGPLHTVILATGRHQDSTGVSLFDWKVRLHFYNGKSYARVFYTLVDKQDEPSITQNTPLSQVTLLSKINLSGNLTYTLAGDSGTSNVFTGTLASNQNVSLLQSGTIDQTGSIPDDGNSSTITYAVSGATTTSGQWNRGWADLSNGSVGLTVAVNYFWQLYPKQFRLNSNGSINVDLWPSNVTPLLMWTAAQKTHEMIYYFHTGSATQAGSDNLVYTLFGVDTSFSPGTSRHHNLFAIAPPLWYSQSRALGDIGVRDLTMYPSVHQPLVTKYFNNVDALLERSLRERDSGGTRGGGHEYMFWNFGDSRDATWSCMAYDTLRADIIHFIISGDRRFYDDLQETAQHWRDVDVEHSIQDSMPSETSRVGFVGTAPYLGKSKYNPNSGGEHDLGSFGRVGFNLQHLKGHGLADHYFLTGDSLSTDVLSETYNYYNMWSQIQQFSDWGETRNWSNILTIMVAYYEVFGTSESKNRADGIVSMANTYQRKITSTNNPGLIWVSGSNGGGDAVGIDTTSSFINGHTMDILLDYMIQIPNSINETQNIIDAVNFEINDVGANRLWTGSYFNCWTGNNYGVPHASVCDYMSVGGFGFAYQKTGNANILNIAKTALSNGIDLDSSNGNLKPYTQKTRIPPGFFYYLMNTGTATTGPRAPTGLTAR